MTTAVLVPGSPLLLPEVGGSRDPGGPVRQLAVRTVAAALADQPRGVWVIAAGQTTEDWQDAPYPRRLLMGGYAVGDPTPGPDRPCPPLGVEVGRSLVRLTGWAGDLTAWSVHDHQALVDDHRVTSDREQPELMIMVADGSGRRRDGGPDRPHPDAVAFDEQLLTLIGTGDARGLAELAAAYGSRADELRISGLPVWRLLAALAGGSPTRPVAAELVTADDPFGVFGLVALWRW